MRICELNARVTGASYPSLLARHFLPDGAWLMRNLDVPSPVEADRIFGDLADSGMLYQPGSPAGVLPINLNTTPRGLVTKGQFLTLGPDHESLQSTMNLVLSNQGRRFTRD